MFCPLPKNLPDSYLRCLENGLREDFDLPGTPIRVNLRKGENPYAPKGKGKRGQAFVTECLSRSLKRARSSYYEFDTAWAVKSSNIALDCRQSARPGLQMKCKSSGSSFVLGERGIVTKARSP